MNLPSASPFAKGKAILASALTTMWDAIRANRVIPDTSSGLNYVATPDGLKLSIVPKEAVFYAKITTACPAFAGVTYGKGAGTISYATYTGAGVGTEATMGVGYPIYNGGGEIIPVGRRIMVVLVNGQFHTIVNFCPAT